MCSGCSGGYQDDYEDPEGDDLDQENPSGTAGAALDNPTDGPANGSASGRERIDGAQGEPFRDFGTGEDRPHRIVRPFEEGYEVLVGVDRILEIRIVRAKHVEFGGLPTEKSPSHRHVVSEKSHKHYQTYAIGYPPYQRPPEQRLIKRCTGRFTGLVIRFCFWGLAAFSVGTLGAWLFLR
jgi:hypothetical protein